MLVSEISDNHESATLQKPLRIYIFHWSKVYLCTDGNISWKVRILNSYLNQPKTDWQRVITEKICKVLIDLTKEMEKIFTHPFGTHFRFVKTLLSIKNIEQRPKYFLTQHSNVFLFWLVSSDICAEWAPFMSSVRAAVRHVIGVS